MPILYCGDRRARLVSRARPHPLTPRETSARQLSRPRILRRSKVARAARRSRKGVAYLQYITYGGVDRKVNDGITFEQSHFSEIHE